MMVCLQAAKRKKESGAASRRRGQEERLEGSLFEVVKAGKASLQVGNDAKCLVYGGILTVDSDNDDHDFFSIGV